MRNLKKILALVLALVMVVGMMTVASAAYTDQGSINKGYTEAVDVLTALGVFEGQGNNTFNPKAKITRMEAAAVIYRAVTGDVYDLYTKVYSDYNQFGDVPSNSWFAGYVNYCANAEFILGDGQGSFFPNEYITGYQVLAIMLRAMGYGQNGEFEGSGWHLRTASTAKELGITTNVTANTLGAPATRELVAELVFKALIAPTAKWNLLYGYTPTVLSVDADGKAVKVDVNGDNTDDFVVYNTLMWDVHSVLPYSLPGTDSYGRPATLWFRDEGDYVFNTADAADWLLTASVDSPVAVYNTVITECDIADDVNGGKTMKNVTEYVNGAKVTDTRSLDVLHTTADTVGAQGRTTEVYKTGSNSWTIVYVDTMIGEVIGITNMTFDTAGHVENYPTLTIGIGHNGKTGADADYLTTVTYTGRSNFSYKPGDAVLVTTYGQDAGDITAVPTTADDYKKDTSDTVHVVGAPTVATATVKGTLGSATTKTGIEATNGKQYLTSNIYDATNTLPGRYYGVNNGMINRNYYLYLDANSNIVGMVPVSGVTVDVGVVGDSELKSTGNTGKYYMQVDLILGDGTKKTLNFLKNDNGTIGYYTATETDTDLTAFNFVKFNSIVKDGKTYYYVDEIATFTDDTDQDIVTGVTDTLGGTLLLNDNTKFLVAEYKWDYSIDNGDGTYGAQVFKGYKAYTGFKNIPTLNTPGTDTAEWGALVSNYTVYVVINADSDTGAKPYSKGTAPAIAPDESYLVLSKAVTYQEYSTYNVVKNGVKSVIKVSNNINSDMDSFIASNELVTFSNLQDGYYNAVTASAQKGTQSSTVIAATADVSYAYGVLTVDSTYLTVDNSCKVQIVNGVNNELYAGTMASIAQYEATGHSFVFELNAKGYVCNIYIID